MNGIPTEASLVMLAGHMADKFAEISAYHRKLNVRPTAVRMRRDLDLLIEADDHIIMAIKELRIHIDWLMSEVKREGSEQ